MPALAFAALSVPALIYYDAASHAIVGRSAGMAVRFEPQTITYSDGRGGVQFQLMGARAIEPQGSGAAGRLNIGQHSAPLFQKVEYPHIYDGIDLSYSGAQDHFKSEYILAPGADISQIRFRYGPGARVRLREGSLVVRAGGMELEEKAPVAYQNGANVRIAYRIFEDGSIGFDVGAYDRTHVLIIDPVVAFSTYWGGSMYDGLTGIATSADGSIYVCGWTDSSDVPSLGGTQPYAKGSTDAFVMKLSAARNIVYATYLGGSGQDRCTGIAVDGNGNAYVTGWTLSSDFPVSQAVLATPRGGREAFVTKLDSNGQLLFSTYLGGSGADAGNAIRVDADGSIYVAGQTTSPDFPTVQAFQPVFGGVEDGFLVRLNSSGSILLYSTFLGGSGSDQAYGLAVRNGEAYVTGGTTSINFPVAGALQASNGGGQDAFVAKVGPAGTLIYSTYLGGSGGSVGIMERGLGIVVTPAGEAVVTGSTGSANFPLASPLQPAFRGVGTDAFIAKFNAAGSKLLFSTYLGGSGSDTAYAIALDSEDGIYVAGETSSLDFPAVNALQTTQRGSMTAFVAALTQGGIAYRLASYFGGSAADSAAAIGLDANSNIVIAGTTASWDYPLKAPQQSFNGGSMGGFITMFTALPPEVRAKMVTPAPGTTFSSATVTFSWDAGSATEYHLMAGTTGAGSMDLFSQNTGTQRSRTVSRIPEGQTIYVRLWSSLASSWQYRDYTYTSCADCSRAALTSPAPGSSFTSSTVTFSWDAGLATQYHLMVGTNGAGSVNVFSQNTGAELSRTVAGLPDDGRAVYVRLWSLTSAWVYRDYTYTACSGCGVSLSAPTPGSTFTTSSVTFSWTAGAGSQYHLMVGTGGAGSTDVYSQNTAAERSRTVSGLPTDGRTVYVRLWWLATSWVYRDYTFTACNQCASSGATLAAMLSPSPGTVLSSSSVTFTWNTGSGTEFHLMVGTSGPGSVDLYSQNTGAGLSRTVSGLPVNGRTLYVRLWSLTSNWQFRDYTYTSCSGCSGSQAVLAAMIAPAPGTVLTATTVTFSWDAGVGATEYHLQVGTTAMGSMDVFSLNLGTQRSRTVTGIPRDGRFVYVRLWSLTTTWQYRDYVYTACSGCQ